MPSNLQPNRNSISDYPLLQKSQTITSDTRIIQLNLQIAGPEPELWISQLWYWITLGADLNPPDRE